MSNSYQLSRAGKSTRSLSKLTNIGKAVFSITTDKKILQRSSGRVDKIDEGEKESEDNIKFDPRGIYSEEIFGSSRDTRAGGTLIEESVNQRNYRMGHIELPVPYISPNLIKRTSPRIQGIIGTKTNIDLLEVMEGKRFLIRVDKTASFFSLESNIEGVQKLEDRKIFKKLEMNNSWYNPEKFSTPGSNCFQVTYYTVFIDKFKEYGNTDAINNNLLSVDQWRHPLMQKKCLITIGGYAVAHLLSYSNLAEDYKYLQKLVDNNILQNEKAFSPAHQDVLIKYGNIMKEIEGLLKNNISKQDLVQQIVAVSPAGMRDKTLLKGSKIGKGSHITKSPISDAYNQLLDATQAFSKEFSTTVNIQGLFENPADFTELNALPLFNKSFPQKYTSIYECINKINEQLFEKEKGKQGRYRRTVKSKRIDQSGGSVIIPGPDLKLDEGAIPIDILLDMIPKEAIKSKIFKGGGLNLQALTEQELAQGKFDRHPPQDIKTIKRILQTQPLQQVLPDKLPTPSANNSDNSNNSYDNNSDDDFNFTKIQLEFKQDVWFDIRFKISQVLENHFKDMRISMRRFPTLHKFNNLGYNIKIEYSTNARLHPLVCGPYNADFDGDRMAYDLVETAKAIEEIDMHMKPSRNLLSAQGTPHITPSQDAVLGIYHITEQPTM